MRTDIYISPLFDIQYTKTLQTTLTGRAETSAQLANLIFSKVIHSKLFFEVMQLYH